MTPVPIKMVTAEIAFEVGNGKEYIQLDQDDRQVTVELQNVVFVTKFKHSLNTVSAHNKEALKDACKQCFGNSK